MVNIFYNPPKEKWREICSRAISDDALIRDKVSDIINRVKKEGDNGIKALTEAIDGVKLSSFLVSEEEFKTAEKSISDKLKEAINVASSNIRKFHAAQKHIDVEVTTMNGVECKQVSRPITRIGLYIPGGSAPLFSTVLMLAIPAKVAGCKEVILCTPTRKDGTVAPEVLYCAKICSVDKVYKIGGAMAIAAMAYGTESIVKVNKIFGPGNRYVTVAKQMVSLYDCAIDMPAGPSEVEIVGDNSSRADFIAADMLSQAEHGGDSQSIAVVNSDSLAKEVSKELEKQVELLSRRGFAEKSLINSAIVVLPDPDTMVEFTNMYAPEHLILSVENPDCFAEKIDNAGSIFLGNYTPESVGDYASGTNHTLPTGGWAVSYSGVNLDSFIKKITIQSLSKDGLLSLAPTVLSMSKAEGLDAHGNAVAIRAESIKNN